MGERLSFICKQWFSLPSPFGEGSGVRLVVAGGKPVVGVGVKLLFDKKKRLGEHIPSFGGAWGGFPSHIEISPLHEKNTILCVPL